ncbi:phosphatase PAP2 family protein [Micromonospora endolithica]|uniref:Phosphatase PAP2 family protein n=1 Tax=Micromonospora endolithica TaxID=230091 RepID=A0A3A9YQZ5_9ACTN|nr:phosphatase PAP2 family protein [Micromonospora endolithica]RKN38403.1 phosphatase PAP2 family protein [Micromonospora endolithica]TWJ23186.1 undecaprenyl-diphosphatase [Micromonospora endolithica]
MGAVKDVVRRPLGHFTERTLAGLAIVLGAGVGFGLLLVLVRVRWTPLYDVDHGVAQWLNDQVSPHGPLVTVLNALTDLGGRAVIIWLVSVAVIGLLIRKQGRLAVFLIVTGLGALILDPSLKTLVDRLRPEVEVPIGSYAGQSFPSGHALGSFVAYGALLLVFLPALRPRWRKPAIALVGVIVFLIGLTRVALGVHFVSDVLGAWLLGAAWLGVTAYAFRLWRLERGRPVPALTEGLEPEAAHDVAPAPDEEHLVPHPRAAVFELLAGWVVVFGALYGFGMFVSYHAGGTFFETLDTDVPRWFADRRTPGWDDVSYWWSKVGDTHAILLISLVFCPLVLAVWRRWRPVLFVALTMFGELSLFLASAAAVDRPRPPVGNLDGPMPTSSFPSGHIAATLCVWTAIAVIVFPRTDRWWRWVFVALAVVMPTGVAISRMYRGMHHPTDFMGAIILTALWVGVLYWVLRPNEDVAEGNRPSIESEDVDTLDDELVKAGRTD